MSNLQRSKWRRAALFASFGFAVLALSACKTTPVVSTEEQARRDEVRAMLLKMQKLSQQDKEAEKTFDAQWERESKKFKEGLKADTDTFPNLQTDILVAVNALAQKESGCKDPNWLLAEKLTDQMEELANNRWQVNQRDTPYYRNVPEAAEASMRFYEMFTGVAIEARFGVADLALKKGCLEISDQHYRHIVERYIGSAYTAHRERAKIGIDDVRKKR